MKKVRKDDYKNYILQAGMNTAAFLWLWIHFRETVVRVFKRYLCKNVVGAERQAVSTDNRR